MKKHVLQTLLIVCGFLVFQACSDDDNGADLSKAGAAAAAYPDKVSFAWDATNAMAINLSVAVGVVSPEDINFEVRVAEESDISADKISLSRDHFTIENGKRSFELACTIEADAVEKGTKVLKIDFMSLNSKVPNQRLEIPVTREAEPTPEPEPDPEPENTIIHLTLKDIVVDFDEKNWGAIEIAGVQVAGFFQTSVAVGTAPNTKRIHFDNYGQNIIGVADGDLINVTALAAEAVIGEGAAWVTNPKWALGTDFVYMPVLYSKAYTAWAVNETLYIGAKICLGGDSGVGKICNAWLKVVANEEAEFTVTEMAYDAWGYDIKAGQTVSEKK